MQTLVHYIGDMHMWIFNLLEYKLGQKKEATIDWNSSIWARLQHICNGVQGVQGVQGMQGMQGVQGMEGMQGMYVFCCLWGVWHDQGMFAGI